MELDAKTSSEYVQSEQQETLVIAGRVHVHVAEAAAAGAEIRLTFNPSSQLIGAWPSSASGMLDDGGRLTVPVRFYAVADKQRRMMCHSTAVQVAVVAASSNRSSASKSFHLPLQLAAMSAAEPRREACVKITIATDQPVAADVGKLFADVTGAGGGGGGGDCAFGPNVAALQHASGAVVTILASKQTRKYRLQSENVSALALPVSQLVRRLQTTGAASVALSLDSPLPVHELWTQIEAHYNVSARWIDATVRDVFSPFLCFGSL